MQLFTTLLASVALLTVGIQAKDDFQGKECNSGTEGTVTCSTFPSPPSLFYI
jgi:hypothetical protein